MTQKMRSMERAVRALKREKEALDRLGLDTKETEAKIRQKTAAYKDFCEACKIKPKTERLRYECGTSDLRKTKAGKKFEDSAEGDKKVITDTEVHDTMKTSKGKENAEVHTVGKINKDIYKCITEDIRTDEVIITDERIAHIIQRRGEDFYKKYGKHFYDILGDPDYIFPDKKNTALVCKKFISDGKYINVALRLVTSTDNAEYKNSIITAVGESEKRFAQRLRNNKPLYKKE